MDLGPGLYVTVVGMGLVFFSLAVLIVAIVLLDRVFPSRTVEGENGLEQARSQVVSPAPQPLLPQVGGPIELVLNNQRHRVEVKHRSGGQMLVLVDGQEYRVERKENGTTELVVDGKAYPARVTETGSDHVSVRVGEDVFRVVRFEESAVSAVRAAPERPRPPAAEQAAPTRVAEPAPASRAPASEACELSIAAPMPGKIIKVTVAEGDQVVRGQELCTLDAMKMENSIRAPRDGRVSQVMAQEGQIVKVGQILVILA